MEIMKLDRPDNDGLMEHRPGGEVPFAELEAVHLEAVLSPHERSGRIPPVRRASPGHPKLVALTGRSHFVLAPKHRPEGESRAYVGDGRASCGALISLIGLDRNDRRARQNKTSPGFRG